MVDVQRVMRFHVALDVVEIKVRVIHEGRMLSRFEGVPLEIYADPPLMDEFWCQALERVMLNFERLSVPLPDNSPLRCTRVGQQRAR